jgi:deoxyadenosine/deoxycytidine kinase
MLILVLAKLMPAMLFLQPQTPAAEYQESHHPKFAHFLSHYYDDLKTGKNTGGGFEMQLFMLCERYEQHRLAVELAWGEQGIVVVQDRPIYGDTVFATTALERGFMTKEEYELYVDVFRNMSRDVMPPDIFIYLNVSPEECHRRMNFRGRKQEEGVPLDYLQHLDKNYQKLIQEMRRRGVRVLVVDGTTSGRRLNYGIKYWEWWDLQTRGSNS